MNPIEVELKLAIAAQAIPALRRALQQAHAERRAPRKLSNLYFDTPERDLMHKGVALRLRKQGRVWLQTVKGATTAQAGLSARAEWEQRFAGHFDFVPVSDERMRALLERHQSALVQMFATDFRRSVWILRPAPDCEIELALDEGEIRAGERRAAICEVELELRSGTPAQLLAAAHALAQAVPLLPDDRSKAERGFALAEGKPLLAPRRARHVRIQPEMNAAAAFRAIAHECIGQVAANALGAADEVLAQDPEFAHQMRVGVRRLRAALKLFAPLLPEGFALHWNPRLRELAAIPGAARQWDVLIDEILRPVAGYAPDYAGLAELIAAAETRRAAEHAAMRACFASPAVGDTLLALHCALDALPAAEATQAPLAKFAARQVSRIARRVLRAAQAAQDGEPDHLHALRLTLKRLRYALEFAAPLVRARRAVATNKIASLQTSLGLLNDLYVSGPLIESLAAEKPELREAIALVGGHHLAAWRERADDALVRAIDWQAFGKGWSARK